MQKELNTGVVFIIVKPYKRHVFIFTVLLFTLNTWSGGAEDVSGGMSAGVQSMDI